MQEAGGYVVGWGTLALINAGLAKGKNRSGLNWFLLSLLLGPLATFILVAFCENVPSMSNDFEWDLDRPEKTVEGLDGIFDVQKAKQIIAATPREIEKIDLVKNEAYFRSYVDDEVNLKDDIDWNTVDCSIPLIFVRLPGGKLQIDGKHRLAKAMRTGLKTLPAIILTPEESADVKVG